MNNDPDTDLADLDMRRLELAFFRASIWRGSDAGRFERWATLLHFCVLISRFHDEQERQALAGWRTH
jgi:hypothetical protein